jgi:hypothetical protein
MTFKCHGEKCDNPIKDEFEYYCPSCVSELIKAGKLKPKPEPKPKVNGAKLIHKAMFG